MAKKLKQTRWNTPRLPVRMDLHPFQVSCNLLIATSPSDTWTHNPEHRLGTNGQSEKQLQYSAEKILVQTSSIFLNESFLERNSLKKPWL
jgi:hypothetical protein